ncbi:MAG: hypothetical protein FLDDKLPJ_02627 [Phycisphaerae bacterium]|nr:hypothetical protein [Phycisphaerae bacterium]
MTVMIQRMSSKTPRHDASGAPSEVGIDLLRRDFLHATGTALVAGAAFHAWAPAAVQSTSNPPPLRPDDDLEPPPDREPSRVVRCRVEGAFSNTGLRDAVIREAVEKSLCALLDAREPGDAWRAILKSADIIGVKLNRSGQAQLGTSDAVARALVKSLENAGWSPQQIVLIETPQGLAETLGTLPAAEGFELSATDFGSGQDELARVLRQVSVLINVPYLKTHRIAGLSGCLKNVTYGLIRHPARFHAANCSPFPADLYSLPCFRDKCVLHLMDALRVVFEGGPEVVAGAVHDAGMLLAGRDPVSVDAVGYALINSVRVRERLPELGPLPDVVPHLADAHRKGLGVATLQGIDIRDA